MRRLRAWLLRLGGLARVGRQDAEITEELQVHRALLAAEYERAGLDPAEARRRAAVDFGSLASAADAYRDRRGLVFLEHWIRDSAYAIRSLGRSPGLVGSMVLVLGLGIGLSTAIATVFHGVVWQGLPVPEPDRVVKLSLGFEGKISRHVSGGEQGFSYPEFMAYRAATRALGGIAGVDLEGITWHSDTAMRSLEAALVTSDYFGALRVESVRGRLLTADDASRPVAVVSYRFWQESLGGRPDVLGDALVLDRSSYTVIGVTDERFTGTAVKPVDVWLPLEAASALRGRAGALSEQNYSWLEVVGRLAPDASTQAATAESSVIAAQFDRDNPGRRTTVHVERASRLDAGLWASRDRSILIGVSTAAGVLIGVLLLICGSNVAGLLLARGATRQKEMAVRVALGASRGRLTQQLAAEVLVIAIGSACVGVLVCTWTFHLLATWIPVRELLGTLAPDGRMFGLALASALAVAFVFGLAPARQAAQVDYLAAIKGDSRPGAYLSMRRLRGWLIAVQVAVSLILLVAAALLTRSVGRVFRVDPGYSVAGLFVAQFDRASVQGSGATDRGAALVREVRDSLANQPGVLAVGLTGIAPFQGSGVSQARADTMQDAVQVHFNSADERYFRALGLTPMAGRFARPTDANVVMVNARLARLFWGDERAAIDRVLEIVAAGYRGLHPVRVVGVLPTVQTVDIGIPDAPTSYVPIAETDAPHILVVRGADRAPVPRAVLDTARALDREAFVTVQSIDERLALVTSPSRLGAAMASLVGILALFIAAVGIHGIVAHAVVTRTREIGIRLALGAPRAAVLRVVVGSSVTSALFGAVTGLALVTLVAVSFSAPMRTALFGMNPLDPTACGEAIACLVGIVLAAAYFPARRALGMAPLDALHHDA